MSYDDDDDDDAKNRHLGTITQLCRAISKARIDSRKKNLLSINISSTCPHNMVNFGPRTAEIGSTIWGTPANLTGFASWLRYCTASSSGRQLNFAALNRGRHLCSAGRPLRWALAALVRQALPEVCTVPVLLVIIIIIIIILTDNKVSVYYVHATRTYIGYRV